MNSLSSIAIFAASLTLSGCLLLPSQPTQDPAELQTQFVGADHRDYAKNGSNAIKGQAALHNDNGGIITCSGNEVLLLPATPFFREVIGQIKKGRKINYADYIPSSFSQVIKKSSCDRQGNFSFSGLPVCTWFIVTRTAWEIAGLQQGGTLVHEVKNCPDSPIIMDNVDIAGP
jgi:hypothetical protein